MLFVNQTSVDFSNLKWAAGKVSTYKLRTHIVFDVQGAQHGALETFSVGQPVYDEEDNLMGFLACSLMSEVSYAERYNGERIPSAYWVIENPTAHCKVGKNIVTFWQRWHKVPKENSSGSLMSQLSTLQTTIDEIRNTQKDLNTALDVVESKLVKIKREATISSITSCKCFSGGCGGSARPSGDGSGGACCGS